MVYCDFQKYLLLNRFCGSLKETDLLTWAPRASRVIDRLTYGRAKLYTVELADELADACARICEIMATAASTSSRSAGLTSASSDGYSESYADPLQASQATERACYAALADALGEDRYGLLYAGVI